METHFKKLEIIRKFNSSSDGTYISEFSNGGIMQLTGTHMLVTILDEDNTIENDITITHLVKLDDILKYKVYK